MKKKHQEMNEKQSISHKAWRSIYIGMHTKYGLYQENIKENIKNGSSRTEIKEEII